MSNIGLKIPFKSKMSNIYQECRQICSLFIIKYVKSNAGVFSLFFIIKNLLKKYKKQIS